MWRHISNSDLYDAALVQVMSCFYVPLQQAGYNVSEPAANHASAQQFLNLAKVEFVLDQVSSFADINVSGK